jgi:hypothetical protein
MNQAEKKNSPSSFAPLYVPSPFRNPISEAQIIG